MYACPWCERKTFSFWQKQTLGPNKTLSCTGCKRRVSVPWGRAHLAALPVFLLAILAMWFVGDSFNSKIFAIAGAFCDCGRYFDSTNVPIVKKPIRPTPISSTVDAAIFRFGR